MNEPIKAGDMLLDSNNSIGMVISADLYKSKYRVRWFPEEETNIYWAEEHLLEYKDNWTQARKRYIKNK